MTCSSFSCLSTCLPWESARGLIVLGSSFLAENEELVLGGVLAGDREDLDLGGVVTRDLEEDPVRVVGVLTGDLDLEDLVLGEELGDFLAGSGAVGGT